MRTSFQPALVVLSIVIAALACYVALDVAARVRQARGRARLAWLAGGSAGLGVGIWSMHFVGMLALRLSDGGPALAVAYDGPRLALAGVVAVATAVLALLVVGGPAPRPAVQLLAGIALGGAVAGMHYLGMAAMRVAAEVHWHAPTIAGSVFLAVLTCSAALWLAFRLRVTGHVPGQRRVLGAIALGTAIAAVHYSGIAAARFAPSVDRALGAAGGLIATDALGVMVGLATLAVLALALGAAVADRRLDQSMSITAEHARLRREAEAARREAEAARDRIAESEMTFRTVADSAPVLIWRAGIDGRCDWFNRPWLEFTGRTMEQELGDGWTEGVHPDDRDACLEEYRRAVAERRSFEIQYRVRRHDGEYRWLLDRGVPRLGPSGEFLGYFGSCIDVHEARRADERKRFLEEATRVLNESIEYEETLAAATRLTIPFLADYCSVDLRLDDGEIRRISAAHRDPELELVLRDLWARYPYRPDENLGVPRVIATGQAEFVPEIAEAAIAAFARDAEHLRMLTELGPHSYIAVPLIARGTIYGALSLVMSSSGRRYVREDLDLALELGRRAGTAIDNARLYASEHRARAAAETANRAKAEFLATMSHELRTPINATLGYVELIAMGLRGPVTDEQRQDLERVRRSQQHLLAVITNILNFSRIEAGHIDYDLRPVPVGEVLADVEAMMAPLARQRSIELRVLARDCPEVVLGDRDKMRQILVNLITNALKFSAPPAAVEVECVRGTETVDLVVRDQGTGIPDDKLSAIFEPFVQLDSSLTRRAEGAGLGLAISRELARGMGGELRVRSTLGAGSTFTLEMPRHAAPPPSAPDAALPSRGDAPAALAGDD